MLHDKSWRRRAIWVWSHAPLPMWLRHLIQWTLNAKYMIGTVCIVMDDAGRVLLVKSTYKQWPWVLPGGAMDKGETTEGSALRELREEASVEGRIIRLLGIKTHHEWRLIEVFFLCSGTELPFNPNAETTERSWFALDALPNGVAPKLRRILKQLENLPDLNLRDI